MMCVALALGDANNTTGRGFGKNRGDAATEAHLPPLKTPMTNGKGKGRKR